MIEINLVPDVKQELIKAQRVRASVISMSIIVGIGAVVIVVVLALWVFAVQAARGAISENTIKTEHEKLAAVEDISDTLTIQNQLSILPELHEEKNINSRIFDIINTINPPEPNTIGISTLELDSEDSTITIEAQAENGYPALEVFKKTIEATTFEFTENGQTQSVPLASDMSDSDRSYGEDASGKKVLRFKLSFTYPEELFSPTATNARIVAPTKTNVTDSYLGVPRSLFTQKAEDPSEEN